MQWYGLADRLRRKYAHDELHHIYGRTGRLLACARFVVPVSRIEHGDPATIAALRKWNRAEYLEFQRANRLNRDVTTCLWAACPQRIDCALAKRAMEVEDNDG